MSHFERCGVSDLGRIYAGRDATASRPVGGPWAQLTGQTSYPQRRTALCRIRGNPEARGNWYPPQCGLERWKKHRCGESTARVTAASWWLATAASVRHSAPASG
jgi:hypothetical protein